MEQSVDVGGALLELALGSSDVDIARACRNPSASSTRAAGPSDRPVCRVLAG
jgi:hypothetical protein